MNKNIFILLLSFCLFQKEGFAQRTIAMPQIVNYSSKAYQGGVQNWGITQDTQGIMYFANNEGLLSFDGRYWHVYPLPNSTIVRSVCFDGNGRIYVGGQDEIGYFEADEKGTLLYHSLVGKIPAKERKFADVWHIAILGEHIFFQANNHIFHYYQDKINVDRPHSSWQYMASVKDALYAQDMERGVLRYENGSWKQVAGESSLKEGAIITGMVPYGVDTLLVATMKDGLFCLINGNFFPKATPMDARFSTNRISSIRFLGNDLFAVSMYPGGMLIIDRNGEIVQRYSYGEGLQTNNIRDIFKDRNGNLWLALDDGIDYIAVNSAIKYIYPDQNTKLGTYSLRIFNHKLYLGTSNGLYVTPYRGNALDNIGMSEAKFEKVPHSDGQVWSVQEVNGRLLIGHEEGSFEVGDDGIRPIHTATGIWTYQAASRVSPSRNMVIGSYLGLRHLLFDGQYFVDNGHIDGSDESLRFVYYDDKNHEVWVSHPYRGVFKLSLSPDFKKIVRHKRYDVAEGLPAMLHNYVFHIRNDILVSTPKGVYIHDAVRDAFIPAEQYRALVDVPIQYMMEDKMGNVWFASNKRLGLLDFSRPLEEYPYTVSYFPELNGEILGGFESVYVHDTANVFISGQKGGILLNYKAYQDRASKPDMLLRAVKAFDSDKKEKLLFGGYRRHDMYSMKLRYAFNSLQFIFSSTMYDQQEQVEFSYMLEGLETKWSAWSNRSEKEYTNLPAGTYVFRVKSRNGMGNESEEQTFSFRVAPPWYAHPVSYVFYGGVLLVFIFWLLSIQRKKLKARHQDELHVRQLEIEKKEKEVIKLRNEKLEAELGFKDKELANLTMNIIQRGEVLSKIKDNITQTMNRLEDKEAQQNFKQLIRLIRSAERTNDDWEKFNAHIHHANENFFLRLKKQHPDLTTNELKLCALLRMNLLSKEIAQLMHVTVKAIEVSRYRLRKKLKIDSEVNLYDYLMQYTKNDE
ncbi:two-component regulator propeller domain-containing protein [Sphingobacterium sp. SGR-19]|uniref:two-component regulator propeller domain-containing protein n=1 Tax=Sphingobacterium sp. SGR-19 TaxID=2710886 RepID=UPI0013ECBA9B|nr:triple tyrosine motif-containing protein [Sphingobacterium sp. SGR-19]NGM64607.1 transcriptional regulator [Sphingobacterium sp. SGR-19]